MASTPYLSKERSTVSITYGECVENHAGMQQIGKTHPPGGGLSVDDLRSIQQRFKRGDVELIDLTEYIDEDVPEAGLLIIHRGIDRLLGKGKGDEMFDEQASLETDKKMFAYGRVVNKNIRHNLCFAEEAQEADFEKGKGTIIPFGEEIPITTSLRRMIGKLHPKLRGLYAEANYYYDIKTCSIGVHGDFERRIVACARLGADFPISFSWYKDGKAVGRTFETILHGGVIYIMSEKAVGTDWKSPKSYTLRHWASFKSIPEKKPKEKKTKTKKTSSK